MKKINDCLTPLGGLVLATQFFNLGGLPPFVGFLVKLGILKLILRLSVRLTLILLALSLRLLFVYVTVFYQAYALRAPSLAVRSILLRKFLAPTLIGFNFLSGALVWVVI